MTELFWWGLGVGGWGLGLGALRARDDEMMITKLL